MNLVYNDTIKILRDMDEKQLIEMFHDIGDLQLIERIVDCATHFLTEQECEKCDGIADTNQKSDYEDWKSQDDAQRCRDIQSDNRSPY